MPMGISSARLTAGAASIAFKVMDAEWYTSCHPGKTAGLKPYSTDSKAELTALIRGQERWPSMRMAICMEQHKTVVAENAPRIAESFTGSARLGGRGKNKSFMRSAQRHRLTVRIRTQESSSILRATSTVPHIMAVTSVLVLSSRLTRAAPRLSSTALLAVQMGAVPKLPSLATQMATSMALHHMAAT